jgi:hypothetical protein
MTDFKFLKHEGAPDNCACCFIDINSSECTRQHYRCGLGLQGYFAPVTNKESQEMKQEQSALNVQVSGSHYKELKIQPVEYIHANNIPFCEASVIKYVTRWKSKGGIADLQKAKHFIDLLIELESKDASVL